MPTDLTQAPPTGPGRQYFPKGTDLSAHTPERLVAVADQLNRRPRKTLGRETPAERLAELLAAQTTDHVLQRPLETAYTRFRRWALDGTFSRMLRAIQAEKDSAGDIDRLVSVDSTIVRAHQHATGGKRGQPIGTKRVITPSVDPAED